MRAYLWTTGSMFGLITAVHLWRWIVVEWELARDPWFVLATVVSAALCIWAWRLMRATARP
jgi:hypothetical protein